MLKHIYCTGSSSTNLNAPPRCFNANNNVCPSCVYYVSSLDGVGITCSGKVLCDAMIVCLQLCFFLNSQPYESCGIRCGKIGAKREAAWRPYHIYAIIVVGLFLSFLVSATICNYVFAPHK